MKKIIFLPLILILISGCSIIKKSDVGIGNDTVQYSAEQKRADKDQEQIIKDQKKSFEQKLRCGALKDDIKKGIDLYNSSVKLKEACDVSWQGTSVCSGSLLHKQFEEIFYSPKLNTCAYLEIDTTFFKGSEPAPWEIDSTTIFSGEKFYINSQYYRLIDALTGSQVDETLTQWRNTPRELLTDLEFASPTDKYPRFVEEMLKKYQQ